MPTDTAAGPAAASEPGAQLIRIDPILLARPAPGRHRIELVDTHVITPQMRAAALAAAEAAAAAAASATLTAVLHTPTETPTPTPDVVPGLEHAPQPLSPARKARKVAMMLRNLSRRWAR